jgi:hypothetical protein
MIGYRKLSIAFLYIISSITLLILGYIPGAGWLDSLTTGMVAFFGGNLVEHITKVIKKNE